MLKSLHSKNNTIIYNIISSGSVITTSELSFLISLLPDIKLSLVPEICSRLNSNTGIKEIRQRHTAIQTTYEVTVRKISVVLPSQEWLHPFFQ